MAKTKTKQGFSLIEMSVVILIVGLMAGAGFSILSSSMSRNDYSNTKAKITEIRRAIARFYTANTRLPCTANLGRKYGDSDYGVEKASCNDSIVVSGESVSGGVGTYIRQGAVPTRTLGLPDEMMYDEYGMKFTYAVTASLTVAATPPIAAGNITINGGELPPSPPAPLIITNVATYVIVSHGGDGAGAYSAGGVAKSCNSIGKDVENCDIPFDGVFTSAPFNDLSRGTANWFDDIIGWSLDSNP